MAGDPQPARVGQSLPVNDEQVGRCAQACQCIEHHRSFAEAQQARYVRKGDGPGSDGIVYRRQSLEIQHDHRGARYLVTDAHVNPGYALDRPQPGLTFHLRRQGALYGKGFFRRQVPTMGKC
jgi:hypothetical protein